MPVEDLLAKMFVARRSVKAVQHADGAWNPVKTPFSRSDLTAHVAGQQSFGHYMLSEESKVKLFAYDLDLNKTGWLWDDDFEQPVEIEPRKIWLAPKEHPAQHAALRLQLRCLGEYLAHQVMKYDCQTAIAYSGRKGLHVYGFMPDGATAAAEARELSHLILENTSMFEPVRGDNFWARKRDEEKMNGPHDGYPNVTIEVFPKQDSLDGKDLGNLMRLPLGINAASGHKAFFVDVHAGLDTLRPVDPIAALECGNPWAVGGA